MSWFPDLLLGIFTRHVRTKILALLLALGLFGFVQASLSAELTVARLELRFSLAEDLREKYVLVTAQMIFTELPISGLRGKIEPLAKTSSLPLLIDQRILNTYGKPHQDGREIPIDAALFRDEVLFGKDVTVGLKPNDVKSLIVNDLVERTVPVEVAPALQQVIHPDYEGRIVFTLNVKSVSVRGPASAFEAKEPRVIVNVANVNDWISTQQLTGEGGILRASNNCEVLWSAGGIKPGLVPLLRVTASVFGSDPMSAQSFQQRLVASCDVIKKKQIWLLKMVPIEIRNPVPREFDLLADYTVLSGFTEGDLGNGFMPQLNVRMPAGLTGNREFLGNLVVVLDVATAEKDIGERLKVRYILDLKDRSRAKDLESLSQIEIVDSAGKPLGADAIAAFTRKKP